MDILLAIIAVALGAAAFALYSRLRDARAKAADAALRLDHALAAQTEAESRLESVQGRLDDAELMLARAREESAAANAAAEGLRNRIEERDTLLQKQTARADELSSSLLAAKEENATLATRLDMLSRREAEPGAKPRSGSRILPTKSWHPTPARSSSRTRNASAKSSRPCARTSRHSARKSTKPTTRRHANCSRSRTA